MTNKNKHSLGKLILSMISSHLTWGTEGIRCHILLRDFVMSRCRQLTVQELHVVGMELMYEKTFNSSQPCRNLVPLVFVLCFECNHFTLHAQLSWLGCCIALVLYPRNVNDVLTKISEIKESLRPPECLVTMWETVGLEKQRVEKLKRKVRQVKGRFPARHGECAQERKSTYR